MTLSQAKGMLRFHKATYKAYTQAGKVESAKEARTWMLRQYLVVRSLRS